MCVGGNFHASSLECDYINWNKSKTHRLSHLTEMRVQGKEKLVYLSYLYFPFLFIFLLQLFYRIATVQIAIIWQFCIGWKKKSYISVFLKGGNYVPLFLTAKSKNFFLFLVVSTWKVSPRSEYLCDPYQGLGLESEGSIKTVVPSPVFVYSYCLLFTLIDLK